MAMGIREIVRISRVDPGVAVSAPRLECKAGWRSSFLSAFLCVLVAGVALPLEAAEGIKGEGILAPTYRVDPISSLSLDIENPSRIVVDRAHNRYYISDSHDSFRVVGVNGDTLIQDQVIDRGSRDSVDAIVSGEANGGLYAVSSSKGKSGSLIELVSPGSNSQCTVCSGSLFGFGGGSTGKAPVDVAVNEKKNEVYVLNKGDHTLSIFDQSSLFGAKTVNVGRNPMRMLLREDKDQLLVVRPVDHAITVINTQTWQREKDIPLRAKPWGISLTADKKHLLVTYYDYSYMDVFDADTLHREKELLVASSPVSVVVNRKYPYMYLVAEDRPVLNVFDSESMDIVRSFQLPNMLPKSLLVSADNEKLFLVTDKTVHVFDVNQLHVSKQRWTDAVIVYFNLNKHQLHEWPQAEEQIAKLNELADWLKNDPEGVVRIEGHTCSLAPTKYNQELSRMRAESVKQFLLEQGVSEKRIETAWFGESMPANDNQQESTRRMNRRAEVRVFYGK